MRRQLNTENNIWDRIDRMNGIGVNGFGFTVLSFNYIQSILLILSRSGVEHGA